MKVRTALLALAVSVGAAQAAPTVSDGWFRALPGNLPAGGYFTLHNPAAKPLRLTGAASPACGMLMLHRSDESGGMARMEDVDAVDVPAGGTLAFAPGGYHLMCMDAKLKIGDRVPVTFDFADGTTLKADFIVRGPAGK
jgi:periplasmic copper chaperone A